MSYQIQFGKCLIVGATVGSKGYLRLGTCQIYRQTNEVPGKDKIATKRHKKAKLSTQNDSIPTEPSSQCRRRRNKNKRRPQKRQPSIVHQYFTRPDANRKSHCSICGVSLLVTNMATTSRLHHLRTVHRILKKKCKT